MTYDDFKMLFYRSVNDELKALEFYRAENPNRLDECEFMELTKDILNRNKASISDNYVDFKLWYNGYPSREILFSQYLINILKNYYIKKILNVGAGKYAVVSEELTKAGYDVYSIDPRLKIKGNRYCKEKFSFEKPFKEEFDLVIGQEPCEATEHIIRYCDEHQLPFIIVLCGVPHNSITGLRFMNSKSWYEYLKAITHHAELIEADILPVWKTTIISRL